MPPRGTVMSLCRMLDHTPEDYLYGSDVAG
jgi:hypothetical protein